MKTLQEAIDAAEARTKELAGADGAVAAAQGDVDVAQKKLDAAVGVKLGADTDDAAAVGAYNSALDDLSAAALAAKRLPAPGGLTGLGSKG